MIEFDVEIITTFNADNPIYSRTKSKSLYGLQVAEDSILTLGARLEKATSDVFIPKAKTYAPKRTGALSESIDGVVWVNPTQIHIALQATEPYAGYIEFGSSKMTPKPFLRPALYDAYAPVLGVSFVRDQMIPNIKIWKKGSKKWRP